MTATPVGVSGDDVLTASIQLDRSGLDPDAPPRDQWQRVAQTYADILSEVRRQPGVRAAGATNFLPFQEGWRVPFAIAGEPPPARPEDAPQAQLVSISEGYLEAMGARLAEGRPFAPTDGPDAPAVVLVNRTFARRYLSGSTLLGAVVRTHATRIGPLGFNLEAPDEGPPEGIPFEIVGVIEDVRNAPLGQQVEPAIYFSVRQFPFAELTVAVAATDLPSALAALRRAVRSVAPTVPIGTPQRWEALLAARTAEPRLLMWILTLFGTAAVLLAATGVYGLFSWSVATRRRELAIRLLLGAAPARVGRSVLLRGTLLVAVGAAAGLAFVRLLDRAVAAVLFRVTPGDPAATSAAVAVLAAAAVLALTPPVLRAMRVDPTEGLASE